VTPRSGSHSGNLIELRKPREISETLSSSVPPSPMPVETRSSGSPPDSEDNSNGHKKGKAIWTEEEEGELVQYFFEVKSDIVNNLPKEPHYIAAANRLRHMHKRGAIKDKSSCKSKFQSVCNSLICVPLVS
jgi:hypothetical protein